MKSPIMGVDGARLYHYVGRDGAGFLGYLFGGNYIGEPAPTIPEITQKTGFFF